MEIRDVKKMLNLTVILSLTRNVNSVKGNFISLKENSIVVNECAIVFIIKGKKKFALN